MPPSRLHSSSLDCRVDSLPVLLVTGICLEFEIIEDYASESVIIAHLNDDFAGRFQDSLKGFFDHDCS